jgi:hypothetical protein
MRCIPFICMLFLSFLVAAAADTKSEDIVAKHLDSIGTPEAWAAVKSRALQGTLHFKELVAGRGTPRVTGVMHLSSASQTSS